MNGKTIRLILIIGACLFFLTTRPARAVENQLLHGHVPEAMARLHLQPVGRLSGTNRLALTIGLPLRNREALDNLLHQLYDPASANYHHFLTPEQFTERFGPAESDYQAIIAFAKAGGLTIARTHGNRTLLDVRGSVADIEKTLHVTMRVYQHPTERRTFYAPDTEPSVALKIPILSVGGLNNYVLPHPMNLKAAASHRPAGAPMLTGSGPGGNYIGNDFRAAYVPGVALTGSGQTVGLLEFDGYSSNDIASYEGLASLPAVPLTNILLDGFDGSPGDNSDEVSLDIEMAISMAPGLAGVVVYEEPNDGTTVDDILNEMAVPSHGEPLSMQLSASWGYSADANTQQIYQQFAAQGQSFFNASGDGDAWVGEIPYWSCEDPNITIVGGTTLTTSGPGGSRVSEKVWNWGNTGATGWNPDGYVGSSGGISTHASIPIWQQGIDMSANHGSTTMRNVPDVALTADNVWVIYGNGQSGEFGGTSCAAPLWAGFTALVNEQAYAGGRSPLGFLNPAIYAIGQEAASSSDFHDITSGDNTWDQSLGNFFAVPGYDLCTGWGTPNGAGLINALALPDWLAITPFSGFTSSGNPGGPFTVTSQSLTLTNLGTNSLSWSLSNTSPWLDVSTTSGILMPGGASSAVTVSLAPAAGSLAPGAYTATLWFTNLDDSVGQGRTFTLIVLGAPVITVQPQDQLVDVGADDVGADLGGNVVFSISVSGATPLNYSWQRNGIYIAGATNATYSTTNMQLSDSGSQFSCVVTNTFGSIVSSNAVVTVVNGGRPDSFNPGADSMVFGMAVQPDGKILVGGVFNTLCGQSRASLGRLNADGTLDTDFDPGGGDIIYSVTVQADGKILVGGDFDWLGGQKRSHLARLNADGTLDTSFNPGANKDYVTSLVVQADGKILVGGSFDTLGGQSRTNLGRLNADGTLDTNFNPRADSYVHSLALQEDGKILVGGEFTTLGGQSRMNLGRLNADGTLDTSFNPGADTGVYSLAVQADGKILVGGWFTTLGGQSRSKLGRLNADGTLDTPFNPGANGVVDCMAVQADGKILVGGEFTTLGGLSRTYLGRLNANGTLDKTFTTEANKFVDSLVVQPDGKILVSGWFTTLGGQRRSRLGRLNPTEPAIQGLAFDGSTITWQRGGSGPEVWRTTFDGSTNSLSWIPLGAGSRVAGGWQLTGLSWPTNMIVRARGFVASGDLSASGWFVETIGTTNCPPFIITQPINQTVIVGETANFGVTANGSPPLSYQWRFNGTNIAGATNASLALTNVQLSQAGNYAVLVTNFYGSVLSSNALLTVGTAAADLITFDDLPNTQSELIVPGGYHGLTWNNFWELNGFNFPGYGYQYGMVSASNVAFNAYGDPASFTMDSPFTLVSAYLTSAGIPNLQVRVKGYVGNVLTYDQTYTLSATAPTMVTFNYAGVTEVDFSPSPTTIFVMDNVAILVVGVPPGIVAQPTNQTVFVGGTATLSLTATGAQQLNYRWNFNGTNISGATNAALTLTNVQFSQAGNYTALVTNKYGSIMSFNALLTVVSSPIISKIICNTDGFVTLNLLTAPNTSSRVLATTNLAPPLVWQPLYTNVAGANGAWQFTDKNTSNYSVRFYRSSTP